MISALRQRTLDSDEADHAEHFQLLIKLFKPEFLDGLSEGCGSDD